MRTTLDADTGRLRRGFLLSSRPGSPATTVSHAFLVQHRRPAHVRGHLVGTLLGLDVDVYKAMGPLRALVAKADALRASALGFCFNDSHRLCEDVIAVCEIPRVHAKVLPCVGIAEGVTEGNPLQHWI